MDDSQFEAVAQLVFMWIGFGTVVGLAAKAIMPGRAPGGSVATLIMGIIGTVIGCALLGVPEVHLCSSQPTRSLAATGSVRVNKGLTFICDDFGEDAGVVEPCSKTFNSQHCFEKLRLERVTINPIADARTARVISPSYYCLGGATSLTMAPCSSCRSRTENLWKTSRALVLKDE